MNARQQEKEESVRRKKIKKRAQRRIVQGHRNSENRTHVPHGSLNQIRKPVSRQQHGCKQPPGGPGRI
jgi:hypothetical protein